ncbi:35265_t:CDS:2, partial [Gigaspora margarita]
MHLIEFSEQATEETWCVIYTDGKPPIISETNNSQTHSCDSFGDDDNEFINMPPLLTLEEAIEQHNSDDGNLLEAWKTFKRFYEETIKEFAGQAEANLQIAAMLIYKKSADYGCPEAQLRYGYSLTQDKESPEIRSWPCIILILSKSNEETIEGKKWLINAAKNGHKKSIEICKMRNIDFMISEDDNSQTHSWNSFEALLEENDEQHINIIPRLTLEEAIEQHNSKDDFRKSCQERDRTALYWIGFYLQYGILTASNLFQKRFYEEDIEEFAGRAETNLQIAAMLIYKKSADYGFPEAQLRYGYGLYTGQGVHQNIELAMKYFRSAAMNNNYMSMYNLGINLILNKSNEKTNEGKKWLINAAKNEIIAESSKKVLSKEDCSMEKDLIYKKNGSSLVDQIKAGIIDISMITESDHNIITTCLNLSHLTTNSGIAINKKALGLCEKQILHKNKQDYLDEIWGIIERVIIEAANKSLPKKKVSNFRHTKAKEFNQTYMHRPILQISRWMRFIRDRLGLPIEETDKLEFNLTIEKINTDLQLEIQQAEDIWMEDTLEVYEPKTTIKEEWYKCLNEEILEEEWVDILKKLKGISAPGQS